MARLRKQYEGIMREIEEHVRQCGGAGVLQYSTKIQWRDLNVTAPELRFDTVLLCVRLCEYVIYSRM
jgi:hypothetical protein